MTAVREGQTYAGRSAFVRYANFVKLPHTVFALPFALAGAALAAKTNALRVADVVWIVIAFTAARWVAMAFNRIADRELDGINPRTRDRELPSGSITVRAASVSVIVAASIFIVAARQLNPVCFILAPVALVWVVFYSYTKRFTSWSHVVLGLGLAIAPVGGYLAVAGGWSEQWWALAALAAAVATWVAGFDVLYAMQDVGFDRKHRLYSIPASLGEGRALGIARTLHALTVILLAVAGLGFGVGLVYWMGVAAAAAMLAYEHSLVRADDLSRLDAAFFTMNGVISLTFFGFVLLEQVLA